MEPTTTVYLARILVSFALALVALPSAAASRYWVGGTNTWNATVGTKWATTSCGTGGETAPVSTDDVFFDANSNSALCGCAVPPCTITTNATTKNIKNFDATGFTGVFTTGGIITINGTVFTLGSGMTFNGTGSMSFETNATVTNNSVVWAGTQFTPHANTVTLADALVSTTFAQVGIMMSGTGALSAAGNAVTAVSFKGGSGTSVNMGSGTWTITGSGVAWDNASAGSSSITASTSTIKLTDATSTGKTFAGGGSTYSTVWLSGAGTGTFTITGDNTYSVFKADTPPHTLIVTASSTQTATTFTLSGSAGNLMTIQSSSAGTSYKFAKTSGTTTADYVSLKDSVAPGAAFWNAGCHSTSVSGNSGWFFCDPNPGMVAVGFGSM